MIIESHWVEHYKPQGKRLAINEKYIHLFNLND